MMNETTQKMIALAKDVALRAYSRYSNFSVGSCIRTDDNELYVGCNVENAAFPSSQCAEACAVGNMVSQGSNCIKEIVVYTDSESHCWPCGNCRQILSEFATADTQVHSVNQHGEVTTRTLTALLPEKFNATIMET